MLIRDWSADLCSSALEFKPHERPLMPGSPATPDHPFGRRIGYFVIGVLLRLAGGFSNGLSIANLPQIQGALGLTSVEGGRTEERRVGTEWVGTGRPGWLPAY